jgi:hypothetical protein
LSVEKQASLAHALCDRVELAAITGNEQATGRAIPAGRDLGLFQRLFLGRLVHPAALLQLVHDQVLLTGLGAPWNTLQLAGTLRLSSRGLSAQWAAGRWSLLGQADLELSNVASALTTLERLGSYKVRLDGEDGRPPTFTLSTLDGALLVSGSGQWTGSQLRFRGEARAAPGAEGELDNLLNFFGRSQGALSLISIG